MAAQNIDGLFEQVGVERMLNCHGALSPGPARSPSLRNGRPRAYVSRITLPGSFATASCLLCRRRFPGSAIEADVFASRVPLCPSCTPELEALERERERERAERPRKRKKVGRDAWDDGGSEDEDGEGAGDERGEWDSKAVIKPDIVFFG